MKKIFSPLLLILPRLALWFTGMVLALAANAQAFTGSLVEDWGWFPERAGIIAAESWGIKPQWQGKTLVESYQAQRTIARQPLLVRTRMVAVEPPPNLPPPVQVPVVPAGFCEIIGEVSDDKLEPVRGAAVEILGTGKTATTNADGSFSFSAVASGNLTLEASKLGYSSGTQSATAMPGQKLTIRLVLKVKAADAAAEETMLDEETVVGEYQENNQGDFNLNINMDAPKLTAVMGREEFTKNAVSDAGEAVAKVSGANIVDGKYAVVRGLADRYVTTTFNGAQIASSDPSRKAVQLDLFPTTAIEQIKVDKTYSPNLPGDFGGGAIDIISRSMPQERLIQFNSRLSYNDALQSKTLVHPNRDLGMWGDIGDDMPDVLEDRNPDGSVKFLDSGNTPAPELGERWRKLDESQNFLPKESDSQLNYSQSFAYGDVFELPHQMKLGVMTAFSRGTLDTFNTTPVNNQVRSFLRDEYSRSAEWTAYLSAALQINENHTLQATYFNKHIAQDDIFHTTQIFDDEENLNYGVHVQNSNANPQNVYGPDYIYYGAAWDISPLERDLQIYQFKGSHRMDEHGPHLDWAITRSSAVESRPHSTHFEYGVLDFSSAALATQIAAANKILNENAVILAGELGLANPQSYTWETIEQPLVDLGLGSLYEDIERGIAVIPDDNRPPVNTSDHTASGSIPGKQRISRRLDRTTEDSSHRQMSMGVPFYFDDDDERFIEFGLGASSLTKDRVARARAYDLVLSSSSPTEPGFNNGALSGPGGLGEAIANNPNLIRDYLNGNVSGSPYYLNFLQQNGLENISTRLDQTAYFANFLFRHHETFFNAGVRMEKETYDIDIAPNPLSAFTEEQIIGNGWENREPQEAILPAISAGTSIFDKLLNFQVAWSQTVARPTFWEFIPSISLDQTTGLQRRGNNILGQTDIDNFDLAITYNPSENTSLRASFFHKNLVRPLVTFVENGTLLYADSYRDNLANTQEDFTANLNGIELEYSITDLGPFSIRSNFTYIDAQLNYFYVQNGQTTAVTSQLPFQPSYIANINLGYEYEPWKLNANLVYNYNGEYPTVLKLTPEDFEVTRNAIHTFDLILAKVIETEYVQYTLRGGVRNLFNAVDTYTLNDKVFDSTNLGRNYWCEIQLNF
jgi:hypothetical protein